MSQAFRNMKGLLKYLHSWWKKTKLLKWTHEKVCLSRETFSKANKALENLAGWSAMSKVYKHRWLPQKKHLLWQRFVGKKMWRTKLQKIKCFRISTENFKREKLLKALTKLFTQIWWISSSAYLIHLGLGSYFRLLPFSFPTECLKVICLESFWENFW